VTAAEVALNGVREEARVGQRTTLDVLNAQQDLVNARVALVTAQRDRVVASYTVLAATGALSPQILGLRIEVYDLWCITNRCATPGAESARPMGADAASR
jgi:outer membrane protein